MEAIMLKRPATWWARETAIQRLMDLDDRMLDDMGVAREEIRERVLAPEPSAPEPRRPRGLPKIVS
jgi:uncharacterized protein YjiS (DUF1127 family)